MKSLFEDLAKGVTDLIQQQQIRDKIIKKAKGQFLVPGQDDHPDAGGQTPDHGRSRWCRNVDPNGNRQGSILIGFRT